MSDLHDNGGPAFPFEHGHSPDAANVRETGMTLRDFFAAHALAVVAQYDAVRGEKIDNLHDADACIAGWAYAIADAMLAERAKRTEGR